MEVYLFLGHPNAQGVQFVQVLSLVDIPLLAVFSGHDLFGVPIYVLANERERTWGRPLLYSFLEQRAEEEDDFFENAIPTVIVEAYPIEGLSAPAA